MQRQLALQQGALNIKTPCQAASDIANYPVDKRIGEKMRPRVRQEFIQMNSDRLRMVNSSLNASQASTLAKQAATDKDAIHVLDMVAGGNPRVFAGLGGKSENRSIGSQWKNGNVVRLSAYAEDQCHNGCPKMQTDLVLI